ncbi:inhibitor of carbonic anhydrase isoform X2 [Pimephales promelas]|uniref:inhibitor of carbonic anhydrase isoform X2 n=1 Tax=Pimephales promelas TaxID=90988 RepID=UPI001955518F|nr:inhibitor of carbonic anhydrase isoform X2 [Pimephales promelas]
MLKSYCDLFFLEDISDSVMKRVGVVVILLLCTITSWGKKIRWCTVSEPEQRKCADLAKALVAVLPPAAVTAFARLSCVKAYGTADCINKIWDNKADLVTLDAGEVYSAVKQYSLTVVAKEIYRDGGCILAVAVVRNNSSFNMRSLEGSRSCHSGARWTAGWSLPLGHLLSRNLLPWGEHEPLSQAVSAFFNASCVPGATTMAASLCSLCQGQRSYIRQKKFHCETSHSEPFYHNQGALRCLQSGAGDVAFVDHSALDSIDESEKDEFRLLCTDGTHAPLSSFKRCNLGRGPGGGVVTRMNMRKMVRKFLVAAQRDEVDAVSLDATHAFIAGKCGLVPVVTEYYGEKCEIPEGAGGHFESDELPSVYGVAVVRRTSRSLYFGSLGGRRSCHGHMYSPAGWVLPARHMLSTEHNSSAPCQPNDVYAEVFWKGCLPGGQGNLCKVCMGGTEEAATKRCADNHNERYYGNMGALRCLVGDPSGKSFGDVAFMEHHNLESNIERLNTSGWAEGWLTWDFELLCSDGTRAPLTEWKTCNLGAVPPNIVMTRPVLTARIYDLLMKSQETIAARPDTGFHLFESQQYGESDLLFKDATKCLVHTSHLDYRTILGDEFYSQAESIFNCTHSNILQFCNQDVCSIF